jgi:hypothetical protein
VAGVKNSFGQSKTKDQRVAPSISPGKKNGLPPLTTHRSYSEPSQKSIRKSKTLNFIFMRSQPQFLFYDF